MDYKATLNLPKTSFPMKAELPKREPEVIARWHADDLYGQIRRARAGAAQRFILHDGPPYANGDIHIGHALNKILKDLIARYKTMRGFDAPYVPGWDCHGMPIEHQLFKELGKKKHEIAQTEFRQKARAYAQRYVEIQREQFKRLGVLGDWEHPYLTMAPDYEFAILRVFRELLEAGYIYRGKKPVYWCATCETALAEAEVEYEDRQDTSIYVTFPVMEPPKPLPETLRQAFKGPTPLAVAVWTTTPWTLPANVAVAVHPQARYVVVHQKGWRHDVIIAEALMSKLAATLAADALVTVGHGSGNELRGLQCRAPYSERPSVVVTDEGVSMEEGTGIVHIAPGHGHEDYLIGQREKLPVLSPVDDQGKFTRDVPEFIQGRSVFDANALMIQDLKKRGLLLKEEPITHSYPHCWRCKQPVIFRATPQWFLSVEHQGLRARLLEAARAVTWIPPAGASRMVGMLESRPDWCLSRQRYWGTPIPMLHCARCQEPILDARVVRQVEEVLQARGIEAWFTSSPSELASGVRCPTCHGSEIRKDTDILDVWFDSGVSYEAVLSARQELRQPADLYLEGSDQHRGWFQVSLIPSVALQGRPPYRGVLTHGFVVDGQGRKMSKSLGNVIAPQDVMQRYGADILRLWVASCDYREDVRISEEILAQVAESYRKMRNTFRYLLSNLFDFDPHRDRRPIAECPELDQWALARTQDMLASVQQAYETSQFHEVVRVIYQHCVLDLSAYYLDALKDRLYTEPPAGPRRRCAQTVLYDILRALVQALAPILVVTTEEVWQLMRGAEWVHEASVHLVEWPQVLQGGLDESGKRRWAVFLAIRDEVMKALETQRSQGVIGSPLEAQVTLVIGDEALRRDCDAHREALAEAYVVSEVVVQPAEASAPGHGAVAGLASVIVQRARGTKCQRCWKHLTTVGQDPAHPELCERCARVVTMMTATGQTHR